MKYTDGQDVKLHDWVKLGDDSAGVVVCVMDDGQYTERHPAAEWSHLERGTIVQFPKYGLIHYIVPEPDLELLARGGPEID